MADPSDRIPAVLTIAGSDSGGGAGIQADLKAFAAAGVHGMSAITALTAQNTTAVTMIEAVSPEMIVAQVEAVAADIGVDAVKVGMLGDATTIAAVAEALGIVGEVPIVLDPVMVSESGSALLEPEARSALIEQILPKASVVTPNLAKAQAPRASAPARRRRAAAAVLALGPGAVTSPAATATARPALREEAPHDPIEIAGELHPSGRRRGSGCTHSSTLAALLARGLDLESAARGARANAGRAVRDGLRGIGSGPGPVDVLGIAEGAED